MFFCRSVSTIFSLFIRCGFAFSCSLATCSPVYFHAQESLKVYVADIPTSGDIITEGVLGLDDIKPMIQKLLKDHISQREITPEISLRAHERFLDMFDPRKTYLLQKEAQSYLDVSNQQRYFQEWERNDFSSFRDMMGAIQSAIVRARKERQKISDICKSEHKFGLWLQAQSRLSQSVQSSWPLTLDELYKRQNSWLAELIQNQMNSLQKGASFSLPLLQEAVKAVESKLQKMEDEWLLITPEVKIRMTKAQIERFMAEKVMKAFGASLDAHSAVFSDQEAEKLKERLSKQSYGTGILYDVKNGRELIIQKVIPTSPASKLSPSLSQGDAIIAINGTSISDLIQNGDDIEDLLGDGKEPVSLSLTLRSPSAGATRKIVIEKGSYIDQDGRLDVQRVSLPQGDAYVLTLHSFYASPDETVSSEQDMRAAFNEIAASIKKQNRPCLGVILDLRDNRGGYLMQAVKVAGLFIRSGVIVVARYSDGSQKAFRDLDPGEVYSGPLIVLTSKLTASAAEIVAEALKDYGVALVVGDVKTYGKGSIQMQTATDTTENKIKSPTENYFKVTVGQYYSVAGESIQKEGVRADIVVPSIWRTQKVGEEFLDSALPKGDPIAERFDDSLDDIPQDKLGWMHRFYTPFLQKPTMYLQKYIPQLREKSKQRVSHDPRWQAFFYGNYALLQKLSVKSDDSLEKEIDDMQLRETILILQDLSQLSQKKVRIENS